MKTNSTSGSGSADEAPRNVKVHTAWRHERADDARYLELHVGDLLVQVREAPNGWAEGFPAADAAHELRHFPKSHVHAVEIQPSPRLTQERAERDAGKIWARESGVAPASAETLAALATRFHQVLA